MTLRKQMLRFLAPFAATIALAACGGSGAPTTVNPATTPPPVADYTGPAPGTADVQAFRLNLWENVKASNRCGGCHNATGQAPRFARNDDVNLAYAEANPIVDLAQPDQSRIVAKVAGGHNCWLTSNQACADIMTTWVRNWAGSVATGGKKIQLQAPPSQDVGSSKSFPEGTTLFVSTLYPLLRDAPPAGGGCARCHSSTAATPQQPFFASGDPVEAYAAARSKINLDTPASSRFVVRLRDESHNCWSGSCTADAATMLARVQAFADGIAPTQVDPSLVVSKALKLYDGTVAAGGNRFDTNLIALYEFKTGTGSTVFDTSGVEPALNLTLSGNVGWAGGWGINLRGPTEGLAGGKAQGTTTASKKLSDRIKATGEYTIEVWAAPANVTQEDAYILSYSGGIQSRNVTLGQRAYQYEALSRSTTTGPNGAPALLTRDADRDAQATLQHVVVTFDPVAGRRMYVNGVPTGDVDPTPGGGLADWDDTFALVLGNETSNNRQWTGLIKLAAVHNRALTDVQVQQNFAAGVGERYFLLFDVTALTGVPQSYIMFEGQQFDSYAYLFDKPTFISLDAQASVPSIPVSGIRLGVNGAVASVGQAYATLSTTINSSNYSAESGQRLANVGTVIALEKGPADDMFFLSFDRIGSHTHVHTEPTPVTQALTDLVAQPDIGVRTFDQINASMSRVTGIPTTHAGVRATYLQVRQQLPPVPNIEAFLASHQTGVAQLAIKYCSAMVDDPTARSNFYGSVNLAQPASQFANPAGKNQLVGPLLQKAVGSSLATQPDDSDVSTEIGSLIDSLLAGGVTDSSTVAKAACAAALGSAVLVIQ